MSNRKNYTAKLLRMKDLIITNVTSETNAIVIYCKMPQREHECLRCKSVTSKVHDYRTQAVKDVPLYGSYTAPKIRKRRYVRPLCGKRFYKKIPPIHKSTAASINVSIPSLNGTVRF